MKDVRNEATAQLADDFIGAAQGLEHAAKQLRRDATIIRRTGLFARDTKDPNYVDPVANQRMHKHYDVLRATAKAVKEIGHTNDDCRVFMEDAQ